MIKLCSHCPALDRRMLSLLGTWGAGSAAEHSMYYSTANVSFCFCYPNLKIETNVVVLNTQDVLCYNFKNFISGEGVLIPNQLLLVTALRMGFLRSVSS